MCTNNLNIVNRLMPTMFAKHVFDNKWMKSVKSKDFEKVKVERWVVTYGGIHIYLEQRELIKWFESYSSDIVLADVLEVESW